MTAHRFRLVLLALLALVAAPTAAHAASGSIVDVKAGDLWVENAVAAATPR